MNQSEYFKILLEGAFEHAPFYLEHFQRECIRAKNNHVGFDEFYRRLNDAWHTLDDEAERQFSTHMKNMEVPVFLIEYNKAHPDNEACIADIKRKHEEIAESNKPEFKEGFEIHTGNLPWGGYNLTLQYYEIARLKSAIQQLGKTHHYITFYNDLVKHKYILCLPDTFEHVMTYKQLPGGAKAITWLKTKTEAIYFQRGINFPLPQFKDCFVYKDGKIPHDHDRPQNSPEPKAPLPDITKKLFDKTRAC